MARTSRAVRKDKRATAGEGQPAQDRGHSNGRGGLSLLSQGSGLREQLGGSGGQCSVTVYTGDIH